MPIQFRCPSCDRMLGIARRKAGSTVKCPRCAVEVRVPALAGMAIASAGPTGGADLPTVVPVERVNGRKPKPGEPPPLELENLPLFERPDFEALLAPPTTAKKPEPPPATREREREREPAKPTGPAPSLVPTQVNMAVEPPPAVSDVDMVAGLFVTRAWLTAAAVGAAVLIGLAFGAGYWLASVTVAKG